ncbi:unnamed protein product [Closterium sp. Naga37s-1]|nr:unnamed protein product [Closterium sp. Naga37s-1]
MKDRILALRQQHSSQVSPPRRILPFLYLLPLLGHSFPFPSSTLFALVLISLLSLHQHYVKPLHLPSPPLPLHSPPLPPPHPSPHLPPVHHQLLDPHQRHEYTNVSLIRTNAMKCLPNYFHTAQVGAAATGDGAVHASSTSTQKVTSDFRFDSKVTSGESRHLERACGMKLEVLSTVLVCPFTLFFSPFPSHPFLLTLSFSPFPSHPFLLTLSFSPFPSHPFLLTLSFSPFPSHPFLLTLSFSPFPSHPFLLTLSFSPLPSHPCLLTLAFSPLPFPQPPTACCD